MSREVMTSFICNLQPDNPSSFDLSAESCFRELSPSISGKLVFYGVKNRITNLKN